MNPSVLYPLLMWLIIYAVIAAVCLIWRLRK